MNFSELPDSVQLVIKMGDLRELFAEMSATQRTDIPVEATPTQEYLTHLEAATYLNVAKQTLYGLVSNGVIHADKRNGKHNRYRKTVLDAYLASNLRLTPTELAAEVDAQLVKNRKGGAKGGNNVR